MWLGENSSLVGVNGLLFVVNGLQLVANVLQLIVDGYTLTVGNECCSHRSAGMIQTKRTAQSCCWCGIGKLQVQWILKIANFILCVCHSNFGCYISFSHFVLNAMSVELPLPFVWFCFLPCLASLVDRMKKVL